MPADAPTTGHAWSQRERELLVALCFKVRFLTLAQVARTWWKPGSEALAGPRRALRALETTGCLERSTVLAHRELLLTEPVCVWEVGEPAPSFGRVAYRLQVRWTDPVRAMTVYHSTPRAARRLGGFAGAVKHRYQGTHDVHVAAVYLRLRRDRPADADAWVSEELLGKPAYREKLPDAVLRATEGAVRRVVEFGGAYDAARVLKLHRYCEAKGLPYELW